MHTLTDAMMDYRWACRGFVWSFHQQDPTRTRGGACITSPWPNEMGATTGEDDPSICGGEHRPIPETHGRQVFGHAAIPLVGLRRQGIPGRIEAHDRPKRGGQDQNPSPHQL